MSKYITEDGEIRDVMCEDCVIYWKTPHNHNTKSAAYEGALVCQDPTLTDESFKEDADINNLMERMRKGYVPDVVLPEHFGTDDRINLFEARSRIAESNATFYNLDADVRAQFMNDPARWEQQVHLDLAAGNIENLELMGIKVEKRPEPPKETLQPEGGKGARGEPPLPPKPPEKSDTQK